jgi:hypothetical protein
MMISEKIYGSNQAVLLENPENSAVTMPSRLAKNIFTADNGRRASHAPITAYR